MKHPNTKHGMYGTPTYMSWSSMKQRCKRDPHYREVSVSPELSSFEDFFACLGERPDGMQLDRIDSGGNYTPDNVRWATLSQQSKNRRPWRMHVDPDRILDLSRAGLSNRAVARHLGYSHSSVNRIKSKWKLEKENAAD